MFRRAVRALATRPGLWPIALVTLWRLARPGWYRQRPWLPRPDRAYWQFRMETAYGDPTATPAAGEQVDYLAWCRRMASLQRRRR